MFYGTSLHLFPWGVTVVGAECGLYEKLLKSQFHDLEEPDNCICVDVSQAPEVIVEKIKKALG